MGLHPGDLELVYQHPELRGGAVGDVLLARDPVDKEGDVVPGELNSDLREDPGREGVTGVTAN